MTRSIQFRWHDQYRAVLLDTDSEKLVERIALVERALIQRARELF